MSHQVEACQLEGPQQDCVDNISLDYSGCPDSCEGVMLGCRREPVTRHYEEGFYQLLKEYDNYKCSNYSDLSFDKGLSGNNELTIHQKSMTETSQISNSTQLFSL